MSRTSGPSASKAMRSRRRLRRGFGTGATAGAGAGDTVGTATGFGAGSIFWAAALMLSPMGPRSVLAGRAPLPARPRAHRILLLGLPGLARSFAGRQVG